MRVICKTNTTKLVKGATYEVERLWNKNQNKKGRVLLKGLGFYVVNNFTQMDGTPLPKIDWEDPNLKNQQYNIGYNKEPHTLKKGDVVVCRWDSKCLLSGKMYRISDVVTTEKSYGSGLVYKETKIKIEGFNRWLNPYRFRFLNREEFRELSLNKIFETPQQLSVDKSIRKIDTIEPIKKRKIILNILFNAILDQYRNNLTIIEWAVQKKGKKWDLTEEDFKPYLHLNLQEIIELMS
jgi:hypothetical protein